jgi:hypothetical protein
MRVACVCGGQAKLEKIREKQLERQRKHQEWLDQVTRHRHTHMHTHMHTHTCTSIMVHTHHNVAA